MHAIISLKKIKYFCNKYLDLSERENWYIEAINQAKAINSLF